jgi:hypothetical protein
MIRVTTLKYLSTTNRSLFRVRRRVIWGCVDALTTWSVDKDGTEGKPDTWNRYEEEFYLQQHNAEKGVLKDKYGEFRPRGVIDQVKAFQAWQRWEKYWENEQEQFTARGRHAMVMPMTVEKAPEATVL